MHTKNNNLHTSLSQFQILAGRSSQSAKIAELERENMSLKKENANLKAQQALVPLALSRQEKVVQMRAKKLWMRTANARFASASAGKIRGTHWMHSLQP